VTTHVRCGDVRGFRHPVDVLHVRPPQRSPGSVAPLRAREGMYPTPSPFVCPRPVSQSTEGLPGEGGMRIPHRVDATAQRPSPPRVRTTGDPPPGPGSS
jgi:hypothetical protein